MPDPTEKEDEPKEEAKPAASGKKAPLVKAFRPDYFAEEAAGQPDTWLVLKGDAIIAECATEAEADAYLVDGA